MRSRFAKLAASIGHAHAKHLLVAFGLLLGLTLAAVGAWVIGELRSDHISHAKQDLTRLSFVLATELDRELHDIDLLALSLIEHMRQLGIAMPTSVPSEASNLRLK
jgi:hypothetical protein